MSTYTVTPATFWRTRSYSYVNDGTVYGGEFRPSILWTLTITAVMSVLTLLVGSLMFLSYTYDKAHCESQARVRPEVNYEYSFWGGCQKGFDSNDHLDVDGDIDVNVNTET